MILLIAPTLRKSFVKVIGDNIGLRLVCHEYRHHHHIDASGLRDAYNFNSVPAIKCYNVFHSMMKAY